MMLVILGECKYYEDLPCSPVKRLVYLFSAIFPMSCIKK